MKYFARIGDREFAVEVERSADRIVLVLDGARVGADVSAVEAGAKYSVLLDRRSFDVTVGGDGERLDLVVNGHAWHVSVEDERERSTRDLGGPQARTGGSIEAVMPGIVRRVGVKAGDAVAVGQPLLILEAMKMENEIRAESEGVVEKVLVADGQTVESGQVLVVLRAS